MRYGKLSIRMRMPAVAGCVAAVLAAWLWCGADASAQGPGLPALGLPGAMNTRGGMIGAGRPSTVAGGSGAPGQLNARVGGRGYSAHSVGQGGALPNRRSASGGIGMAGVPQTGQFRAGSQQFRGQNMTQSTRAISVPGVGRPQ